MTPTESTKAHLAHYTTLGFADTETWQQRIDALLATGITNAERLRSNYLDTFDSILNFEYPENHPNPLTSGQKETKRRKGYAMTCLALHARQDTGKHLAVCFVAACIAAEEHPGKYLYWLEIQGRLNRLRMATQENEDIEVVTEPKCPQVEQVSAFSLV